MTRLSDRSSGQKKRSLKKVAATRFASGVSRGVEIRFGEVVVNTARPAKAIQMRNVAEGRSALIRAKSALVRPGVEVRVTSGVPLYHADPESPNLLLRTLNGKTVRGRFVGGKFKPA